MTVPSIHRREMRRRLALPTPTDVLPAEVRDDLDAAADCDAYAAELLESEEYIGAAEALGAGDLWRVLAVISLVRWLGPPRWRCVWCPWTGRVTSIVHDEPRCPRCERTALPVVDVELLVEAV